MSAMASQMTGVSIVCSIVFFSCVGERKHQSPASLTFVRGIHRWPVHSPHKGPVKRKCFQLMTSSFYDVIHVSYIRNSKKNEIIRCNLNDELGIGSVFINATLRSPTILYVLCRTWNHLGGNLWWHCTHVWDNVSNFSIARSWLQIVKAHIFLSVCPVTCTDLITYGLTMLRYV